MFKNNADADDDDDDSSDENLTKQVLPTADDQIGPVDMNKMPTTGEEYLRQVRYETSIFFFFVSYLNVCVAVDMHIHETRFLQ
jgi:hypothetical protein